MKKIATLMAGVSLMAVCFCGKSPEEPGPVISNFAHDTLAVRAILDANGKNTISTNMVSRQTDVNNEKRITELNLDSLGLSTIPSRVDELSELTFLQLQVNTISSLPATIKNLTKVTVLNISNNNLTGLPDEIGGMTSLLNLRANDNKIAAIPPSIGNLRNLQSLYMSNNELTTIPDTIAGMDSLDNFTYDSNRINPASRAQFSSRLNAKLAVVSDTGSSFASQRP